MVLILETRSHLDVGDLPNLLAAEMGVMTVRLERAIRSLDGVARVHVNRWGDGAAHLHLWFLARPVGQLQLRGSFLSMWDEILEPVPEPHWRESLAHVSAWLGEFGGRALVEPPRIEWHAPSGFGRPEEPATAEDSQAAPDESTNAGATDTGATDATDTGATDATDTGATDTGTTDATDKGATDTVAAAASTGSDDAVSSGSDTAGSSRSQTVAPAIPRQPASDDSMAFLADADLDMSKMR